MVGAERRRQQEKEDTPMETELDTSSVGIFYDGPLTLAVHRDGSVWCGGERGQIYRIEPNGSSMKQVASSGGFSQGMTFDAEDNLYVCDLKHSAVMRLDARSGALEKFADGVNGRGIKISNFPAFDSEGRLYVSDSHAFKEPGPGIFRFNPDGSGELWYDEPINFANGLALSADGRHLYVAETFGNAVFRVAIEDDGSAGIREEVAPLPGVLPDGLAFDAAGNLYVACYEPSQVLLISPDGAVSRFIGDEKAYLFCQPTNLAFRGNTLFTTNLGRWHITVVETSTEGLPLYGGYVSGR
jgi:gluconolactonase